MEIFMFISLIPIIIAPIVRNKKVRIVIIIISISCFMLSFCSSATARRNKSRDYYNEGIFLLEEGDYNKALECFQELPSDYDYGDTELLKQYFYICPHCGGIIDLKEEYKNGGK